MLSAAEEIFNDDCGSVPLSELIRKLLGHPPPPPPWVSQILNAADLVSSLRDAGERGAGGPIETAAVRTIQKALAAMGQAASRL